jgi:predicted nucleic acid-binding protein
MKKLRLYLDTSVFGGVYDNEFKEASTMLFDKIKAGKFVCIYSRLCLTELETAPDNVKTFFANLPKENLEFVEIQSDAYELAHKYVAAKVVGKSSFDDCVHIATATICNADFLISWNFKHIVNVFRIKNYNSVNMQNGYKSLDIRSPKEVIYD